MLALLFFIGVCILLVLGALFVVIVRRLSTSRHVIVTGRIDLVRAKARADAAERVATQLVGVTEQSVQQVGQALHVASQIDKVSGQMDELLDYVASHEPKRGRHHAGLRAVPDGQEGYVA